MNSNNLSAKNFHKEFSDLCISTSEISTFGFNITKNISKTALSALIIEPKNEQFSWHAAEDSAIKFNIERESKQTFLVKVAANLSLNCKCVRCLNPINESILLDFSIRMIEKESILNQEFNETDFQFDSFEVDINSEEESQVGYFSDQRIDLGLILRDQIFLSVPDYPHCKRSNSINYESCAKKFALLNNNNKASENPFVKLFNKIK